MKAIIQLLMLAVVAAEPTTAVAASNHRSLASQGCNDCCFKNDCRLAFSQTSPGICCGAHRIRGQTGCCPMGASCVACANIWKCSRSSYITRTARCSICRDDMPPECRYSRGYHGYHHTNYFMSSFFFLMTLCGIAACMFYGRSMMEPDVVMVQGGGGMMVDQWGNPVGQPQMVDQYGRPIQGGPGGQTVIVQGGGYGGGYGGGMGVAGAAATGFVGGMMVGEMMDHGDHGYGGGYGGDYGGGGYGGGGMDGGDGGMMADQ